MTSRKKQSGKGKRKSQQDTASISNLKKKIERQKDALNKIIKQTTKTVNH